jgi:prepilin-type N-terminal cleavage/methylation domain-containing protein
MKLEAKMLTYFYDKRNVEMKQQKGFTLIEMAIVLVIVGLLLGGVLKGQELIDNSRIKNTINDMKGVSAAYNGYFDRFRALPGDDGPIAALQARGGLWTGVTLAGNSNGILNVTAAQTFTGAGENTTFFQHVRAAGFIGGNVAAAAGVASLPVNAFGGVIGVTGTAVTGQPVNGKYTCASRVPGKAARAIDVSMDDGVPNTGALMATTSAAGVNTNPGAAATTYIDTDFYTICAPM